MRELLIAIAVMLGVVATWPYGLIAGAGFLAGMVFGETRHWR